VAIAKACIHQSKQMYYNTINTKKLKPSIVASYNICPGNERAYSGFGA